MVKKTHAGHLGPSKKSGAKKTVIICFAFYVCMAVFCTVIELFLYVTFLHCFFPL